MTPNPSRSQIFSPKPPHCDLVLVEDLIDESKNRNIPLLSHLFSDVEVQSILSLSLSFRLPNDKLIWHYDRKGIFSVKSAYHVTRDWIQSRREALHPPLLILPVRLGRNYGLLGCLLRLRLGFVGLDWISSRHVSISIERGFKTDMVCVLCGAYGESTNHLMWDCIFKMYDIPRVLRDLPMF